MFKALLVIAFTAFASVSIATPPPLLTCSCSQTFGDFIGNEYDLTVHVRCPAAPKEILDCSGKTDVRDFSATCTNMETGEANTTTAKLDPGSDPNYGYLHCSLN